MHSNVDGHSTIREKLEIREDATLAVAAVRSRTARRERPELPSAVRTEFQRDRDRILHTKSFRRLMHKTQVFIAPAGDHYRTRLTHTLEVTQIARTIGRALGLNEDLIEAIGLGHDLGHTPFGHAGETALARFLPGFRHNEQSLRVVEVLEKDGQGLNLTDAVRDGILHHSKPNESITGHVTERPNSFEAEIVKISDGIAYINHDLDDAIRAGMIAADRIPSEVLDVLGHTHAGRIDTLVTDIVANSVAESLPGRIAMSPSTEQAANTLRAFLFEAVYEPLNRRDETVEAQQMLLALCDYFLQDDERLPEEYRADPRGEGSRRRVADYVASMTDRFAIDLYSRLFVPGK